METKTESPCIPIGVFWDIENCCVPKWKSALHVVQAIRNKFFVGHREAEFMCVCDTSKQSKYVIQELNQAQINVVHIDAVSKNAADDKLRQNIRRFSDTQTPPATILLISSDVNFSSDLYDLRYRKKFNIIVIHSSQAHDALILSATEHYLYDDIVGEVPCRSPSKPLDGEVELKVTGFKRDLDPKAVKVKLQQLSNNTGGKVVSVTMGYALLRFSSLTVAERAKQRMEGEDVYGSKIHVDYSVPGGYNKPTGQDANNNDTSAGGKGKYSNNNISPKRNRPYSQRKISPKASRASYNAPPIPTENRMDNSGHYSGQTVGVPSPAEAVDHYGGRLDNDVQGVVNKFAGDHKTSRQLLMLQQQLYQEEQETHHPAALTSALPPALPNTSTQFYSHVTKYEETNYYGYGGGNQWQQQNNYQGEDNSGRYQNQYNTGGYDQSSYGNPGSYYYQTQPPPLSYHQQGNKGFWPISRSNSPSVESSASASPCEFDGETSYPGTVELIVSNLDYNISPREWRHILMTTFHPHVKILHIDVSLQPDNTSLGFVRVGSIEEARFAISQFHRKKIGYKRIHVTLKSDDASKSASSIRSEAIALLSEAKGNVLPLFKFIELFNKRFNRSVSVSELYKMKDTIEIREQGGSGRMIHLNRSLLKSPNTEDGADGEVQEILEHVVCGYHCPEGSLMYTEAVNTSILPNVKLQLKTFAAQIHSLLMTHDGNIPLMSFPACFSAEVAPLSYVYEGGIPLEHLISCVPGVQIVASSTGVKKVSWAENKPPSSPDLSRQCSSPLLAQQLSQFGRDMIELLKGVPNCRLAFSKFIPTYHHFFGRQCRVADYGYSKLMELFEAVQHIVQVLGTGDRKVLTLTHRAQTRRFTADLQRLLKALPGKLVYLSTLTEEFCKLFNKSWDITEYGLWCVEDMLADLPAGSINVATEGNNTIISLPRKDQTSEELERTKQFSLEVVDLLKHSHQFRMLFNKFIPAYHHHFGRQCRVSDYGFTKLQDLFEALPHIIELEDEGEEKVIRLTEPELCRVVGEQLVTLLKQKKVACLPLEQVLPGFSQHYGFTIPLQDFQVGTVEELMGKLKHVLKVELFDGKTYVVLADRTSAPPLARQVLQLLMDQSGGSLPLMELCSRYKTTFGVDPDIRKIKEELLDYVVISGDDESGVISLTALQTLARDIRVLLQVHGKVSLASFEKLYYEQFCQEIKPALYGFPTLVALLMAIPHVVSIKGKGNRRVVHLSGDLSGSLPIIDESYTRPDSDTPSNDSGSALTDEDTPCEQMKPSPIDLLGGTVPSGVPSPNLVPSSMFGYKDLIHFDPKTPDYTERLFKLSEEERKNQISPLCRTPTSELLHMAAQFLPSSVESSPPPPTPNQAQGEPRSDPSQAIMDLLKNKWWQPKSSPLAQSSDANKDSEQRSISEQRSMMGMYGPVVETVSRLEASYDNASTVASRHPVDDVYQQHQQKYGASYYEVAYDQDRAFGGNISKSIGSEDHDQTASKEQKVKIEMSQNEKSSQKEETGDKREKRPITPCPRPLQPGSYWFSKLQASKKVELPSTSSDDVRKVLASLTHKSDPKKPSGKITEELDEPVKELHDISDSFPTPTVSIDETSGSISVETITETSKESIKIDKPAKWKTGQLSEVEKQRKATSAVEKAIEHKISYCVADDCMCYEAIFRQDHPLETSSIKSDSSFTGSPGNSPVRKVEKIKPSLSTSSLSDDSNNSSLHKRKSRIAAKFGQPIESQ